MTQPPLDTIVSSGTRVYAAGGPDDVCAAAIELARAAAVEVAGADSVGDHVGIESDGERIATHHFASLDRAYTGWQWAVTVVRPPRSKNVTIDEVVLLPGADALLAPEWVPWNDRLQAGDLGVGDVLPTAADDERLLPGYAGVGPHDSVDDVDTVDALVNELWLGRPRVLSDYGRDEAASRWYDGEHGPNAPIARAADKSCASCGFLVLMRGALSRVFGVCANEFAPDDGRVVSFDHGCGAHSEALVIYTEPQSDEPTEVAAVEVADVEPVEAAGVAVVEQVEVATAEAADHAVADVVAGAADGVEAETEAH
ncbi:MAG: DUF3027 domain-containing protein [Acidothermaceae bacterium]